MGKASRVLARITGLLAFLVGVAIIQNAISPAPDFSVWFVIISLGFLAVVFALMIFIVLSPRKDKK